MLLPQSNAFRTLHARLNSVPALALLQLDQNTSGLQKVPSGMLNSIGLDLYLPCSLHKCPPEPCLQPAYKPWVIARRWFVNAAELTCLAMAVVSICRVIVMGHHCINHWQRIILPKDSQNPINSTWQLPRSGCCTRRNGSVHFLQCFNLQRCFLSKACQMTIPKILSGMKTGTIQPIYRKKIGHILVCNLLILANVVTSGRCLFENKTLKAIFFRCKHRIHSTGLHRSRADLQSVQSSTGECNYMLVSQFHNAYNLSKIRGSQSIINGTIWLPQLLSSQHLFS